MGSVELSLDSVRDSLVRQEDSVVFSLIERARFPRNAPTYDESLISVPGFCGSLVQFVARETECVQAKAGRYENLEENPFFPHNLPPPVMKPYDFAKVLHPSGSSININKRIWDLYFEEVLPLIVGEGDDGNYAATAASDIACLQALSWRIHYGKFVAEVKFRGAPQDYEPAIRAQDRDALMKLLTFEDVEEMVKKRVGEKAKTFGQYVTVARNTEAKPKYKVDPAVASRVYGDWVIPLTKLVQVEYLLCRVS